MIALAIEMNCSCECVDMSFSKCYWLNLCLSMGQYLSHNGRTDKIYLLPMNGTDSAASEARMESDSFGQGHLWSTRSASWTARKIHFDPLVISVVQCHPHVVESPLPRLLCVLLITSMECLAFESLLCALCMCRQLPFIFAIRYFQSQGMNMLSEIFLAYLSHCFAQIHSPNDRDPNLKIYSAIDWLVYPGHLVEKRSS